jgi:hypothetical protein
VEWLKVKGEDPEVKPHYQKKKKRKGTRVLLRKATPPPVIAYLPEDRH